MKILRHKLAGLCLYQGLENCSERRGPYPGKPASDAILLQEHEPTPGSGNGPSNGDNSHSKGCEAVSLLTHTR